MQLIGRFLGVGDATSDAQAPVERRAADGPHGHDGKQADQERQTWSVTDVTGKPADQERQTHEDQGRKVPGCGVSLFGWLGPCRAGPCQGDRSETPREAPGRGRRDGIG